MAWNLGLLGAASFAEFLSSFDLLEHQSITTAVGSVTFSNLNTYAADYQHLQLRLRQTPNGPNQQSLYLRFNDTTSSYSFHGFGGNGSTIYQYGVNNEPGMKPNYYSPVYNDSEMHGIIDILDFSSTNKNTTIKTFRSSIIRVTGAIEGSVEYHTGAWFNTAAVTSLSLVGSSGVVAYPAEISLYGMKKVA
jgi:hypothetical protein